MNRFENEDAQYFVMVNDEDQYSLWPETVAVPAGWGVVHGSNSRKACLDHVTAAWPDMRPKSLRDRTELAGR